MRRVVAAALLCAGCYTVKPHGPAVTGQTNRPYEAKPYYLAGTWTREHLLPGEPPPGRQVAAASRGGSDVMVRGDAQKPQPAQPAQQPAQPAQAAQPAEPPQMSQSERLRRIRAELAAINGHLAAIDDRGGRAPTPEQQRALALTIEDLGQLLETYPDVEPEADELRGLVERLPDTPPGRMSPMLRRMQDLSDLILLQLFAGR